ncbi:MAG TPA: 30S ribosome-binding factor RbfA [Casimicrobiaceae bacterium]|jgi:ribosome-binding factor A|nr:30S ribosome-binding factor RbfA [Gemmatimonadaceae bacterium]HWD34913.1 30S ribosome-binding factor RbfA [Casimicrobiaceae bacterium]
MSPDHRRADRVAEGIREVVARFLTEGVKDPRVVGLVTVTGVDVTRDLRHARVYVTVLGDEAVHRSTLEGLASLAAHLRPLVARALRLRLAPEIEFRRDETAEHATRIESLLARLRDDTPTGDAPPRDEDADD